MRKKRNGKRKTGKKKSGKKRNGKNPKGVHVYPRFLFNPKSF